MNESLDCSCVSSICCWCCCYCCYNFLSRKQKHFTHIHIDYFLSIWVWVWVCVRCWFLTLHKKWTITAKKTWVYHWWFVRNLESDVIVENEFEERERDYPNSKYILLHRLSECLSQTAVGQTVISVYRIKVSLSIFIIITTTITSFLLFSSLIPFIRVECSVLERQFISRYLKDSDI